MAEIRDFRWFHNPPKGGENSKAPITHESGALDANLKGTEGQKEKVMLPEAKVKKTS